MTTHWAAAIHLHLGHGIRRGRWLRPDPSAAIDDLPYPGCRIRLSASRSYKTGLAPSLWGQPHWHTAGGHLRRQDCWTPYWATTKVIHAGPEG